MKGNSQTIHDSIRVEAFLLSEKAGHPNGMEHDFWTQAEAIVRTRATAVSVAVEAVAAKPAARRATKPKAAVTDKPGTKARAVKAAKPKAAGGVDAKARQLLLDGEPAGPARKRAPRK